ncbi:MAG: hypothetical protein ABI233_05450 [Chthoniobacterales bacterium]
MRSTGQILRSRGIGAGVGTLIGIGWLAYGLIWFPNAVRVLLVLLGATIVIPLLLGSKRLIAASRKMPVPNADELAASRRVWKLFWLNFVFEIVLLNIAINLFQAPSLRIYWIPAISFVVGLHFLPMTKFFAVSSYWITRGAMIVVAVATALAMRSGTVSPLPRPLPKHS